MVQVWKPILDFPGYEITEIGEIRSYRGCKNARALTPRLAPTGYIRFGLMRDGRQCWRFAHRLIWQSFVGPIPDGLVINHKNGVKNDNNLSNLEVVTISENGRHAYRVLGIAPQINPNYGEKNGFSKLSSDIVRDIRHKRDAEGLSYEALGIAFGINKTTAHRICNGITWRHV